MMVPKKSLMLAGAALVIGAAASAQSVPVNQGKALRHLNKPLRSASIDLATGVITRGPSVRNRGTSTIGTDFTNIDLTRPGTNIGFIAVDSGNQACRWFSAADKGNQSTGFRQTTNASDLMENVTFAYCSAVQDVNSGGPGGSTTLNFYEGYTWGGGAPSTNVATVGLTGLPSNTATTVFNGGANNCFFFVVNFNGLVAFADGDIGYSWRYDDLDVNGVLGGTIPFLACQTSCSNVPSPIVTDGQGMVDVIDAYCSVANPTPQPLSFTFGTITMGGYVTGRFTGVNMQVGEKTDLQATLVSYNASISPNFDTLTATTAVVGSNWTATVVKQAAGTPGASFVLIIKAKRNAANGAKPNPPIPLTAGRVLTSGAPLVIPNPSGTHNGTTGSITLLVPADPNLCNLRFTCQSRANGGPGGAKFSNGIDGTIGTIP